MIECLVLVLLVLFAGPLISVAISAVRKGKTAIDVRFVDSDWDSVEHAQVGGEMAAKSSFPADEGWSTIVKASEIASEEDWVIW